MISAVICDVGPSVIIRQSFDPYTAELAVGQAEPGRQSADRVLSRRPQAV